MSVTIPPGKLPTPPKNKVSTPAELILVIAVEEGVAVNILPKVSIPIACG